MGEAPSELALADFDADGRIDLAMLDRSRIMVAPGTGNGRFGAPTTYVYPARLHALVVADLEGDGRPDILAGGEGSFIAVLRNTGTGFRTEQIATSHHVLLLTAGRIFGGSVPDVAVADRGKYIYLYQNDGRGRLTLVKTLEASEPTVAALALGDFDGDGSDDLAVGECCDFSGRGHGFLRFLWNDQAGNFSSGEKSDTGMPRELKTQRANGQVYLHFSMVVTGSITSVLNVVMRGNPDRTFKKAALSQGSHAADFSGTGTLADMNADGLLDYVAAATARDSFPKEYGYQDRIRVHFGSADMTFQGGLVDAFGRAEKAFGRASVADLNHDGRPDVVVPASAADPPRIETFLNLGKAKNQCPVPTAENTVRICSPQASSASPVHVLASAHGKKNITTNETVAMQLYVNGELRFEVTGSNEVEVFMNRLIDLPAGNHHLLVKGWNDQKESYSAEVWVNVR